MDTSKFSTAQSMYDMGDYQHALSAFSMALQGYGNALEPGDTGYANHMIGNCYVKMKDFDGAIPAYEQALLDTAYPRRAALNVNLGMALSTIEDYAGAVACFKTALMDPSYETPYKAYSAMGAAQLKLGKAAEAGVSYRKAALDKGNPDPARSLVNLGVCFMALDRPADAVESYKTALELDTTPSARNKTYANMGQALLAMGRARAAKDAFDQATADGTYKLQAKAMEDYQRAMSMLAAGQGEDVQGRYGSSSAPMQQGPYGDLARGRGQVDQRGAGRQGAMPQGGRGGYAQGGMQQPASSRGSYGGANDAQLPPPDDTGFFSLSDDEIDARGRYQDYQERKLKNIGPKVFLAVAILVLALVIVAGVFYIKGYGVPMQETVIEKLFQANAGTSSDGSNVADYWVDGSSSMSSQMAYVAKTDDIKVDAVTRSMDSSTAYVTATLNKGGQVRYQIELARDGLSWKVSGIKLIFASEQ